MIEFIKGTRPKLRLTPREGFKRRYKEVELDLVYGHVCPTCANVIQAVAYATRPVNLFPYEETTVLSQGEKTGGEILKTIPGDDPDNSGYEVRFHRGANPEKGNLLHLRLKNHIVRVNVVKDKSWVTGDNTEEVGERCCYYTGVFSPREDLAVKDLLMMFNFTANELEEDYTIPKIQELIPNRHGDSATDHKLKWAPAVGDAPPVILVERSVMKSTFNHWLRTGMKPFQTNSSA